MVFLDSPMAGADHEGLPAALGAVRRRDAPSSSRSRIRRFDFPGLKITETTKESKAINAIKGTIIIIAGSGMCTAGRIKHHLVNHISRPESTIMFVGYQAVGTLGRRILDGDPEVRILGPNYPVKARVVQIPGLLGPRRPGGVAALARLAAASRRGSSSSSTAKPKAPSASASSSARRPAGTSWSRTTGRK